MPRQYNRPIRPVFIPIGPSIAYVTLSQGAYALIDSWNAWWIGKKNWHLNRCYAVRNDRTNGHIQVRMHCEIAKRGGFDHPLIDHHNNVHWDNRECNLRRADRSENMFNRKLNDNSTSRYKGVHQHCNGKWHARIQVRGIRHFLGAFDTPEEAYAAYCKAAILYHGEFARLE